MSAPSVTVLALAIFALVATTFADKSYLIPAPDFARPESVAHSYGTVYYTASMLTGDLYKFDISNNTMELFAKAPEGAGALGTFFDHSTGLILVAGAGNPKQSGKYPALYVYGQNGRLVGSCYIPDGGMVNDVTSDGNGYAYWTDSFVAVLYKLKLSSLPYCEVEKIPLPYVEFTIGPTGRDMSNGIVYYNNGVIIAHTVYETFYYIDFLNNNKATQVLPFHAVTHADGLLLVKEEDGSDTLYLAEPRDFMITKWKIRMTEDRQIIPTRVARVTSPNFYNPTSPSIVGNTLVASNIDFRSPFHPPPGYQFYITVVPDFVFEPYPDVVHSTYVTSNETYRLFPQLYRL